MTAQRRRRTTVALSHGLSLCSAARSLILSFHGALARPVPDTDHMTYAQWVSETNLHAVETMAEYLGIDLEPAEIPGPVPSPVSTAHEHLSLSLRSISADDAFVAYQVRIAFRLARHLERFDQIGPAVTEADRQVRRIGEAFPDGAYGLRYAEATLPAWV
jgi:hypothetical protein